MYRKKLRIIAIFALVMCLAVGYVFWTSLEKYVFKEAGFYPGNGMKYEVLPGDSAKLEKNEDYASLYLSGKDAMSGEELCVYSYARDAIILTSTMCFVTEPDDGVLHFYKLSAFTDIQRNLTNLLISTETRQYIGGGVLLYNGDDTYIVLEPAVLEYGENTIELSPLSYVIACNGQWVQYYDYNTDNYVIDYIEEGTDVVIGMDSFDINILADTDRIEFKGEDFMFFTAVSHLNDFFENH